MRTFMLIIFSFFIFSSMAIAGNGLVNRKSNHDVKKTADRLENILHKKGMTVFDRINHTAGAKKAGKELRPTELIIFGNPKVGTPLMQCSQTMAIDLPQKALIWEDEKGQVWLSYNEPEYLAKRHKTQGCLEVIRKVQNVLANFASGATTQ